MARLVLASTSRYRRELVERLGIPVEVMAPDFDERAAEAALAPCSAEALACALAAGKARSLAPQLEDALVIGADQIAEIDGERLHKPGSEENARAQLRRLAGRTHRLVTAVTLLRTRDLRAETVVDVHHLTMRPLSDGAIARYVERDRPLDCAGSYKIEALGIALFERVAGDDFTAVIGLPLTAVVTLLARLDVHVLG
jgi:septum formation protein